MDQDIKKGKFWEIKKLKYVLPIFLISAFPLYFETVAKSYEWLTPDRGGQAVGALVTIIFMGFLTAFILDGAR